MNSTDKLVMIVLSIIAVAILILTIVSTYRVYVDAPNTTEEFIYKNHSYIYFEDRGVVHNPECKKCYEIFD